MRHIIWLSVAPENKHGPHTLCQPGFTRYNMIRCGLITPCWLFVWRQRGSGKIPPQGDIGCALRRALFLFLRVTWLPERNNNDDGEFWLSEADVLPPDSRQSSARQTNKGERWTRRLQTFPRPLRGRRRHLMVAVWAESHKGLAFHSTPDTLLFIKWVYVHMFQRPFPVRVSFVH